MGKSDKTRNEHVGKLLFACFFALLLSFCFSNNRVFAESSVRLNAEICETENDELILFPSGDPTKEFPFADTMGNLTLTGNFTIEKESHMTRTAYTSDTDIILGYDVSNGWSPSDDGWKRVSSKKKLVYAYPYQQSFGTHNPQKITLDGQIGNGVIILQESADGENWSNAIDPMYNCFDKAKSILNTFYVIKKDKLMNGTFFRVLVAYEMNHKTGTESFLDTGLFETPTYDSYLCVESYQFYVEYGSNPVKFFDICNGQEKYNRNYVEEGFILDKCGANVDVKVKRNNGIEIIADNLSSYVEPGKYVITVTTPLKHSFTSEIEVKNGLGRSFLTVVRHENSEKDGYKTDATTNGNYRLTSAWIGQDSTDAIVKSSNKVVFKDAYGILGSKCGIYLKVKDSKQVSRDGYEIVADDWGSKNTQTICDVATGKIETGAVIVQKSTDGINYVNVDLDRYSNGLFTTDYYNHYSEKGDVLVYQPDGTEIQKGIFIKLLYAYEIKKTDSKDKKRCVEEYSFYLCSNNLGAVTFHNMTLKNEIEEACGADDEVSLTMHKKAESLLDGSVTTTGFRVDKSLNPTVRCTVSRNGVDLGTTVDGESFTETGRYVITLESRVGSKKTLTLYVDAMSADDTYKTYFGDGLIQGKRIYNENSTVPVYEEGYAKFVINKAMVNYQSLQGEIKNEFTNETIIIPFGSSKTGELKAGEYVATFFDNPTFASDYDGNPSGDNKEMTFRFKVIQNGTAPGPKVNQKALAATLKEGICGCYPKYYAISYKTPTNKTVTLAFATKEDALTYAKASENMCWKDLGENWFQYDGTFVIEEKYKTYSARDKDEAIEYFAEHIVKVRYIDPSNRDTYRTLHKSVTDSNERLNALPISMDVVVFADETQKAKMGRETTPVLNDRPYVYLLSTEGGSEFAGNLTYQFVKDKYECDSHKVVITDRQGREFNITYGMSVDEQLARNRCATGYVTINEETIYGDKATYEAIYFANGDNTARITINVTEDGLEKKVTLDQSTQGQVIKADAFWLSEIADELEPYDLITVERNKAILCECVSDELSDEIWTQKGTYNVSVTNRIGNRFTFSVEIETEKYAIISFEGEGTDEFESLFVKIGDREVELPTPERYGYDFDGYAYEDDAKLTEGSAFGKSCTIHPNWQAKQVKVVIAEKNGNELDRFDAKYGEVVDLSLTKIPEGCTLQGFENEDGAAVGEKAVISKEGTVRYVAVLARPEGSVGAKETEEITRQGEEKNSSAGMIAVIVAVIIIALAGAVTAMVMIVKRRKTK